MVSGVPAQSPDEKADPTLMIVDGEPVEHPHGILAVIHKPAGFVCSHDRNEGPTIYELLPERWSQRNPSITTIGRLDKDATGVLLVSDDGELVHRWTSPKHKVSKIYEVTVNQDLQPRLTSLFASGELLLDGEDKPCVPAKLEIISAREARLELTEGRYHQVKRMFSNQGFDVLRLHRSRFGDFELGDLLPGQLRLLPINLFQ